MKRVRFKRVSTKTPEQLRQMAELAEARKKRMKRLLTALDIRHADIFGYEPDYTFPGYRSRCGAFTTVLLMFAVLLRVATRGLDFLNPQAIISENRLLFERDMQEAFELPKFGLVFKRTGWKPFYDPTYFTFRFQQGISGRASNSTYQDLGDRPCSFVDAHGRIIEDEARCPDLTGTVLGNFFDDRFRFIHVAIARCRRLWKSFNSPCTTCEARCSGSCAFWRHCWYAVGSDRSQHFAIARKPCLRIGRKRSSSTDESMASSLDCSSRCFAWTC